MHRQSTSLPLKILVIDDNRDFAYALSSLINHLGFISSIAYDKKSGMRKIMEHQPDLVLCDIGLPGRGCYEIADKIRSEHSMNNIMLAALTYYVHDRVKRLVDDLGFDFYISKPIQSSILNDMIQEVQARKLYAEASEPLCCIAAN